MVEQETPSGAAVRWPRSVAEFERLIDAMQHRLVEFAFRRLQSRAEAEDVVQDVMVRAWRDRERYGRVDNAVPFLFRMVSNRAADVRRRRRWETGPPVEETAEPAPAETVRELRDVEALLGRLPARQAEVIRLRVWAELPFEEVALALGCPVPTVKSRFRYGVQKLRKALKGRGGER